MRELPRRACLRSSPRKSSELYWRSLSRVGYGRNRASVFGCRRRMARLNEHANEIALAEKFAERLKGKERKQYQQAEETGGEELIQSAAVEAGNDVRHVAVMNEADQHLFKRVQDQQEN